MPSLRELLQRVYREDGTSYWYALAERLVEELEAQRPPQVDVGIATLC